MRNKIIFLHIFFLTSKDYNVLTKHLGSRLAIFWVYVQESYFLLSFFGKWNLKEDLLDSFNCLFSFLFTTLNLSNNFSNASPPVVTEDRIFKDNLLQKFNEFIGKISCHESFDCARYILRILGLRQSCLYNLNKNKVVKTQVFLSIWKKGRAWDRSSWRER